MMLALRPAQEAVSGTAIFANSVLTLFFSPDSCCLLVNQETKSHLAGEMNAVHIHIYIWL